MLFHIIADYGHGDLAFAEVVQRLKVYLPDAEYVLTPVPAFSTLAAGFCIGQLGLNDAPAGTIIYHNVAPRADIDEARSDNAGEGLAYALLPTGTRVIGVNAGYAFSFIRDSASDVRWAAVSAEGSQFRSRDLFPQAAAAIALGQPDALGEPLNRSDIPEIPHNQIAYIDGYGNIKTTIEQTAAEHNGQRMRVRVGDTEQDAIASDGSFAVANGQLAFAPGSSGWLTASGKETRWVELFLRGGNAWEFFGRPEVGSAVEFVTRH
ncbi:MAG: SAM-dependent chlorinase/fluorinase [Chloroflexota bacterium]